MYTLLQILSRVGTLDARMPLFLSLLHVLCGSWPHLVLELSGKVKESLEYLHHLSPDRARHFLAAIGPLLQQRRELRDALMLVLRKAVFQRSLDTRVVAVDGFAVILHQRTGLKKLLLFLPGRCLLGDTALFCLRSCCC
jgi:hypothetical protein